MIKGERLIWCRSEVKLNDVTARLEILVRSIHGMTVSSLVRENAGLAFQFSTRADSEIEQDFLRCIVLSLDVSMWRHR